MTQLLSTLLPVLAWAAIPVTLIAVIDDWFLRPRRRLAQGGATPPDPPLMRGFYLLLPVVLIAVVLELLGSEKLDFSLVLIIVVAAAGAVWLIDHLVFAPLRRRAAQAAGRDPAQQPVPVTVDYARSFFPVAVVVLLVRMGILSIAKLKQIRPYVVVGAFVVAAVVTPPDVFSQLILAIPLILLYEVGIVAAWLLVRQGKQVSGADEAA